MGKLDDAPGAESQVLKDASGRVEEGIAIISIAVLYPSWLRQLPSVETFRTELANTQLKIAICSEAGQQGWMEYDLNYLADVLRRTFEQLVKEDVVTQAVEALEAGVHRFAQAIASPPAAIDRCAQILGIGEADQEATD